MQPIIISNPISLPDEIPIIHQLFDNGLELLHLRKPGYSEADYHSFLSGIYSYYRSRCVLHQFHPIAAEFGINRLHFSEQKRRETTDWNQYSEYVLSTSVHSIEDFNELPDCFEYAFLSPVFPSISKTGYASEKNLLEEVNKRTNFQTELIALGGITNENKQIAMNSGFDNVAMLGAIWDRKINIKKF